MENILIATAILWVLSAVVVMPLTNVCVARRLALEGVEVESIEGLPDERKQYWEKTATGYYVLCDVIVLGIAGLIGGLLGYYFIGISFEPKGWPGMIAFIGLSFLGLSMRSTAA